MASVCGSQICLLRKENNAEIKRHTIKSARVTIGNHPLNTVRVHAEQVERIHCKIAANKRNEVEIINLSTRWPVVVNGVAVAAKAKLNDMDRFEVAGCLFRWHYCLSAKSGMKKKGMKQPKSKHTLTRKRSADDILTGIRTASGMTELFFEAMRKRRTIHSVQSHANRPDADSLNWSFENDEHSISTACFESTNVGTLLRKKQMNHKSVHTAVGANKENDTPNPNPQAKTPKPSQLLHTSSVMIMSYTPTQKKTERQEYLCYTPISSEKHTPVHTRLDSSLSFAPCMNVSNTGESIYLMDLTTPPASKRVPQMSPLRKTPLRMLSAANTLTPSPKKNNRTPASTLLKSVLRNAQAHKDLSAQLPVPEHMEPVVNVVSSTETVEGSDERTIGAKNTFEEQIQTTVTLGTPDFDIKSVIKKPNCTEQVRSSRYSDITPHESFEENDTTNQQVDGSTFVDLTISPVSRVSIQSTASDLEIVEQALLDDESDDSNVCSPYNEDELLASDSEFSQAEEIPNQETSNSPHTGYDSLRDTRKFIGSAFTSLHTSRPQLDLTAEIDESLIINDGDDCAENYESCISINDSCEEEYGFDGITRLPPTPPPLDSHLIKETVKAPSLAPEPQHYEEQNKEKHKENAPLNNAESMGDGQYRASTNDDSSLCINEQSETGIEPSPSAQPQHSEKQSKKEDKKDAPLTDAQSMVDAEECGASQNDLSSVDINEKSAIGCEPYPSAQLQQEHQKEEDKEDATPKDAQSMVDAEECGASQNDLSSVDINEKSAIGCEPYPSAQLQQEHQKEEDKEDAPLKDVPSIADAVEYGASENDESSTNNDELSEIGVEPSTLAQTHHFKQQQKEEDKEDAPLKDAQSMVDAEECGASQNDLSSVDINEKSAIGCEPYPSAQLQQEHQKEEDKEDAPLKDVPSIADAVEYGASENDESSTNNDELSEIGVEPSTLAQTHHFKQQQKEEDKEDATPKDAQSMVDAEECGASQNDLSSVDINEKSAIGCEPYPSAQLQQEHQKEEDKVDAPLKDAPSIADAVEYGASENDESSTNNDELSEIGVEPSTLAQTHHFKQQQKEEDKEDATPKDAQSMVDAEECGASQNDLSSVDINEKSAIGCEPYPSAQLQQEHQKEEDKEDAPLKDAPSIADVVEYGASENDESSTNNDELSEIGVEPSTLAQTHHFKQQQKEEDKEDAPLKDAQSMVDAEECGASQNDLSSVDINEKSAIGCEPYPSAQLQQEHQKEEDKEDAPLKDVPSIADAVEYGASENDESSTNNDELSEIGVEPSTLAQTHHFKQQQKEEDKEDATPKDAQSMVDAEECGASQNDLSSVDINEKSAIGCEPYPSAQLQQEHQKEEDKVDAPLKDAPSIADAVEYGASENDESSTNNDELSEIGVEPSTLAQTHHFKQQQKEEDKEDATPKDAQSMVDAEECGASQNDLSSVDINEKSAIGCEPYPSAQLQQEHQKEEDKEDAPLKDVPSIADAVEYGASENDESSTNNDELSEIGVEPSTLAQTHHFKQQQKEEDKEDAPLKVAQSMVDAEECGASQNDLSSVDINEKSAIGCESYSSAQLQQEHQKEEDKEDAPLKDVPSIADAVEYGASENDESSTNNDELSEIGVEPSTLAQTHHFKQQQKEEDKEDAPLKDAQSMVDAEECGASQNDLSSVDINEKSAIGCEPYPSAQLQQEHQKEEDKEDAPLKDVPSIADAVEYGASENDESSTNNDELSEIGVEPSTLAQTHHFKQQQKEEDKEDAPLKDAQSMVDAEECGASQNDLSSVDINEKSAIGCEPYPSAQLQQEHQKEEDKEDAPLKDVPSIADAVEYGASENDESSTNNDELSEIGVEPCTLVQLQHFKEQQKEEDKEDGSFKEVQLKAGAKECGPSKNDECLVCTNESADEESSSDDTKSRSSPKSDSNVSNLGTEEDRKESVEPVSSTTKDVFKHPRTPVVKRRLYSRNQHELKTPPIDAESPKCHVVSNEYPTLPNEIVPKEASKTDPSKSTQTTLRRQLPPRASRNKIKSLSEEVIAGQSPELKFCKPKPSDNENLDDTKESTSSTLTMIDERRKIVFNNVVAVKHFSSPDIVGDVIKNTNRRGTKRATKQPGRKNTSDDEYKAPTVEPIDNKEAEPKTSGERDQTGVQEPNSPDFTNDVTKDVAKKASTLGKQGVKKGNKNASDDQRHGEVPQTINNLEIISQEEQSMKSPGTDVACVIVTSTPQLTTPLQLEHTAIQSHHNALLDVTPGISIDESTPVRRTRRGAAAAAVTASESNGLLRPELLDVTPGTSFVKSTPVRRPRRGAAAATVTLSESNVAIDASDTGHEIESKLRTRRGRAPVAKETQHELPKRTRGNATKAKKGDETTSTTLVDSGQEQNLCSTEVTFTKRLQKFASSTVENNQLSNDQQEQNDPNNVAETTEVEKEHGTIVQEEVAEGIEKPRRGRTMAAKSAPKQKAPSKKDAAPKKGRPRKAPTISTLDSDVDDSTEKDVAGERLATEKGRKAGKRLAESAIDEAVNDSGPKKTRRGKPATAKPDVDPNDLDGENVHDEASLKKGRRGRAAVSKQSTEQDSEMESAPKRGRKARQPATSKGDSDLKDASKQDIAEENLPVAKGRKPRKKAADASSKELTSSLEAVPKDSVTIESDTAAENVKTPEVKTKSVQRRGKKNKDAEIKYLDAAEQLTAAVLEIDNESEPVRSTRRRRV